MNIKLKAILAQKLIQKLTVFDLVIKLQDISMKFFSF